MECNNIRKKISAYIEGVIISEERVLIEEHLKSCQKCNEYFTDMEKTIEYVHSLENIEPPVWLTHKVMARIKSEVKPKKGIVQRLFCPLYVKLPIQAVTAVIIAITTFYIFKTIQPETKFAKVPSEESMPQILGQEEDKATDIEKSTQKAKKSLPTKELEIQRDKPKETLKTTEPTEQPNLFYRQKAPAPVVNQNKGMPFADSVAKDSYKTEELSHSSRTKTLAGEKKKDISLTFNVKDIEAASKEIEEAVVQCEGKIITTKSFEDKKVLTAELNYKKVQKLIERLKLAEEVRKEKLDLENLEGNIRIKIEIIKF